MPNNKEVLRQVISYLLAKNNTLSFEAIQEIICTANILHLIWYGRPINDTYKPDLMLIESLIKDPVDHFEYTSQTDREALDSAVLRNELDNMPSVIKTLGI
jgi:hypothetical protein